jgi:hypothetical protein
MVASLVGGISLASIDAYEARQYALAGAAEEGARLRERAEAAAAEAAQKALAKEACARRALALDHMREETQATVMRARTGKGKALAFTEGMLRWNTEVDELVAAGCGRWLPSPPRMTARQEGVERKDHEICGGSRGARGHSRSFDNRARGHSRSFDNPLDGLNL